MTTRVANAIARWTPWQIDVAGTVIVGVLAGVWYFAGLRPLTEARAAREALESEMSTQQLIGQDKIRVAASQERELARTSAEIAASDLQVQPVERINAHVSNLEEAAAESGLRVDEIKPSTPIAAARFTTVPIRMSGAGNYAAVSLFLRYLRVSFRDTGITGFRLVQAEPGGPGAGGADALDLRFELDLVWYAAPKQPAAKK